MTSLEMARALGTFSDMSGDDATRISGWWRHVLSSLVLLVFAFTYGMPTVQVAHAHAVEAASHDRWLDATGIHEWSSPPDRGDATASCCVAHCLPALPLLPMDETVDRWPMTVRMSVPNEAGEGRVVAVPLRPPRGHGRT
ncbi:hypothetical protein [Aureimonas phyllosphaerae]|uniref:DUF2946 domain-containing protein n=1 Tax=Aureimonas phyllosphaerae TaxID=1166078 RepID=A0A7W6BUI8_9HYPH|nr:hypothetical protein [Aureimonas phyllosphaerae]MBB3934930.1 hypothetical protein [Aureimonas phyllosphaerae]MBB3958938.1 hypothetical protein [Aureimonas phyllosphaerae]SFF40543.1 hypothetical protein SAMN05216566_11189 [Aureimonas phyllosphaerae]